jgi:hypothetical protein
MNLIQINIRNFLSTSHLVPIDYEMNMLIEIHILLEKINQNFAIERIYLMKKKWQTLNTSVVKTNKSISKTTN